MRCARCGLALDDDAQVCGNCGAAVGTGRERGRKAPPATVPGTQLTTLSGPRVRLLARATGIVARPAAEWLAIAAEPVGSFVVLTHYAAPLAAIGAVALFLGQVAIGLAVPMIGIVRASLLAGIVTAAILFAFSILAVVALGALVNALAPRFGGERNGSRAFKLAVYSHTPVWLAGIAYAVPWIGFLWLAAGLYAVYLAILGLPVMMRCPKERAPAYAITAGVCGFVLFALVGSMIVMMTGFGPDLLG